MSGHPQQTRYHEWIREQFRKERELSTADEKILAENIDRSVSISKRDPGWTQ